MLRALLLISSMVSTQDTLPPWLGGITMSLGQPPRRHVYAQAGLGFDAGRGTTFEPDPILVGGFGITKDLSNPVTSVLAGSFETFLSARGTLVDGGARAFVLSTALRLSAGVEYRARDEELRPFLGLTMPVRRGGVFGGGTLLRAEFVARGQGIGRLSVLVPIAQPRAGRTRPRTDRIDIAVREAATLARPAGAATLDSVFVNIRAVAQRIDELLVPGLDVPGPDPQQALAPLIARLRTAPPFLRPDTSQGLDVDATIRSYHAEVARVFSIAASGHAMVLGTSTALGDTLAARARAVLLEHALFPFNRLLGQKKTAETFSGLSVHARGTFARELVALVSLPPEREAAVQYVFQELLAAIDAVRARAERTWRDSRLVWLPLQLALRPEDHDTQEKIDRLVERAVGRSFTNGNRVWYIVNAQFQSAVIKSIKDARNYHVLWIHDFRGRNELGEPDAQSLRFVVDAYLEALTARVRAYDSVRVLPIYMIFLDQHYYEANRGRLWLDFLERPLDSLPKLDAKFAAFRARVREAQLALRQAVNASRLLQAEAAQYGAAWLRNQIKVQVNITNQADPSFWSRGLMPGIGIPDNVMRDHRKIVFYDVTEEDPYRGLAIYTGMGVGEHYMGPTWEDRAIMAQGPVLITLKEQARQVLLSSGLSPAEIPYPLRPRPKPDNYEAQIQGVIARERDAGQNQRAMELHNLTGFGDKPINVAKATLYTLMPRGSVIKVPDSLWGSSLYAALLCGSAFRGVRVLFIAPSLASAPSAGWPQMALAHDLFARLIVLQRALRPELADVGGLIKTGIYSPEFGVQEIDRRFVAAYENARRTPFLRRLFPTDTCVDILIPQIAGQRTAAGPATRAVSPKLHLKANFFATREGWDSLVSRPALCAVLIAYIKQLHDTGTADIKSDAESLLLASRQLEESFRARLTKDQQQHVAYYLIVGSANQDYRSMFMDGEASILLAGWSGIIGLIDFGLIANLSIWVDDLDLLDQLLPPPTGFHRRVARWLRPLL
jgi:hypothetical protein